LSLDSDQWGNRMAEIDEFLKTRPMQMLELSNFLARKDFVDRYSVWIYKEKVGDFGKDTSTFLNNTILNMTVKGRIIYVSLILSFIVFGIVLGREFKSFKIGIGIFVVLVLLMHAIWVCANLYV